MTVAADGVRRATALLLILSVAISADAPADSGWLEAGDAQLRLDLQLLNDAEVIRYPVTQWPIPREGVRHALKSGRRDFALNASVEAALQRVTAMVSDRASFEYGVVVRAGEQGRLRDFDTQAREDGELGIEVRHSGERFDAGLRATAALDAADGQELRADGSHATVRLGNWLLSANLLDRWWGPGHEGSLILSSNARPMPTLSVERATARPFESRWLRWLGPWRTQFAISQMEREREDIDSPLFMAWRVVAMPFKGIELGVSRTAQFCGEQQECNLNVFGNLLAGNDNRGIDADEATEPGNQMAGFDMRWNSPIGNGPYAIYAQYIGEDESSYLPAKYIAQMGLEGWKPFANGNYLQWHIEYANTVCSALSSHGPYYGYAYNQIQFNVEGYRYRGRVIGHTTDGDSESYAAGLRFSEQGGGFWALTARAARLNIDGAYVRNTVSQSPAKYAALELGWRGRLLGGAVGIELGVESYQPENGTRDVEPYGQVGWRHDFR